MDCKKSVFRMNIFDSQLAFILSIVAMFFSFLMNVFQCVFRNQNRETENNQDHDGEAQQENSNSQPQNSTPLLVPQIMESTNFRAYFPERNKYEDKFQKVGFGQQKSGEL